MFDIHVNDISLYISCVLFQLDKNSGCYGNLYFLNLYLEKWKLTTFIISMDVFGISFYRNVY